MLVPLLRPHTVNAAQITNRTLTLLPGATDGGSKPGGVVNHKFTFTLPNGGGGNIGSIKFEYCTIASVDACVTPQGLSTTSATLSDQQVATGFTLSDPTATNGTLLIQRAAPAPITAGAAVTYQFNTVTNPNVTGQPNYTFFVRISTYATIDGTGTPVDTGSVAASTASQITLTGTMPESLIFCTGADISTTNGIPDCSTATAGNVTFNQLFSPTDTASAVSKLAASTNALSGYNITVNGPTLTSGSNTIPGITAASGDTSKKGTGQFGMNLVANTSAAAPGFDPGYASPTLSGDITPASNGSDLKAAPNTGYGTPDTFRFDPAGQSVAQSNNGGSPGPTNSQIYTASYIVNVTGAQPAGTYATTLTYICTATF